MSLTGPIAAAGIDIGAEVVFADNLREDLEKNLRVQAEKFKQALAPKNQ